MGWNYRKWATIDNPAHKSHLQDITSSMFACLEAFRYSMESIAAGEEKGGSLGAATVSGKSAYGTATHETISRALTNRDVVDRILGGARVGFNTVAQVWHEELEVAKDGRELGWYAKNDNPDKLAEQKIAMVVGLLNDLHNHVAEIVLVEPGFIARLFDYWIAGHVDLVYRPRSNPKGLAFSDWKTGASLPHPIELEHGFESGFYAQALKAGIFLPREAVELQQAEDRSWIAKGPCEVFEVRKTRVAAERAAMEAALIRVASHLDQRDGMLDDEDVEIVRFDAFPDELQYVHMGDYVPYERAGSKKVDRSEHLAFYQLARPGQVKYVAGDLRGPAWYAMRRRDTDVARLEHLLRQVVGVVRMGRFFKSIGEKCTRCAFKADCLTAGYGPRGDEHEQIERALRGAELDGFDGLGGDEAA